MPLIALWFVISFAAPLCDPVWIPVSRDPAVAAMVVQPLADTVADLARPRFAEAAPVGALEESLRGLRGPIKPRYGQVALLIEAGSTIRVPRGTRVLLVPWQFGEDCAPMPWLDSATWAPRDTASFVMGWLRPSASWVRGMPTFDVEVRGWQPIWRDGEPRLKREGASLLTAIEFLALYQDLPTHLELQSRAAILRSTAAIRRRLGPLVEREPAQNILALLERIAASLQTKPELR